MKADQMENSWMIKKQSVYVFVVLCPPSCLVWLPLLFEKWISVYDIEFIRVIQYNKIPSNFATEVDFGLLSIEIIRTMYVGYNKTN
jgi:hypothetical protein